MCEVDEPYNTELSRGVLTGLCIDICINICIYDRDKVVV